MHIFFIVRCYAIHILRYCFKSFILGFGPHAQNDIYTVHTYIHMFYFHKPRRDTTYTASKSLNLLFFIALLISFLSQMY